MKFPRQLLIPVLLLLMLGLPQPLLSEETADEVFLLEKQGALLAFSGLRNRWIPQDLRAGETVVKSVYDGNVGVAYTNERVLGFSTITNRWAEERLRIRESVESISAEGNIGTAITNTRALGFSARKGVWVESLFSGGE